MQVLTGLIGFYILSWNIKLTGVLIDIVLEHVHIQDRISGKFRLEAGNFGGQIGRRSTQTILHLRNVRFSIFGVVVVSSSDNDDDDDDDNDEDE